MTTELQTQEAGVAEADAETVRVRVLPESASHQRDAARRSCKGSIRIALTSGPSPCARNPAGPLTICAGSAGRFCASASFRSE